LVHLRVVQQGEVVGGAHVMAVFSLEGDSSGAALSGGAGYQHEDVAKQPPKGVVRAPGNGGRDEEVRGPLQQRHLFARRGTESVGVVVPPVLVNQGTLTEVADAGGAPAQESAEHPCL